jgi:hypothetical protein
MDETRHHGAAKITLAAAAVFFIDLFRPASPR